MQLTATAVRDIFTDCLYNNLDSIPEGAKGKPAPGIIHNFMFRAEKIDEHANEIRQLLDELPPEFKEGSGGGMSFLAAALDKNGCQWGEHRNMEELFTLGMAAGYCSFLFPKEIWHVLPGGVPYYVIHQERKEVQEVSMDELKKMLMKAEDISKTENPGNDETEKMEVVE